MENCSLKEIIFDKCRLQFGSLRTVMVPLKKNQNIKKLKFENLFIHEKQASVISEMLKINKGIEVFTIDNCGLDDAAMIQIS